MAVHYLGKNIDWKVPEIFRHAPLLIKAARSDEIFYQKNFSPIFRVTQILANEIPKPKKGKAALERACGIVGRNAKSREINNKKKKKIIIISKTKKIKETFQLEAL